MSSLDGTSIRNQRLATDVRALVADIAQGDKAYRNRDPVRGRQSNYLAFVNLPF